MIFMRPFAIWESVVADLIQLQILHDVCLVDLCQLFSSLSRISRSKNQFTSERCFPVSESCHVWPLVKLKLVGFFPSRCKITFPEIRHPRGSPVMISCQTMLMIKQRVALAFSTGFSGVRHQVSPDVHHKVSPGVRTQRSTRRFLFSYGWHCEMKMDLPKLCTAEKSWRRDRFVFLCVIFCLQHFFGFSKDASDDGTIAVWRRSHNNSRVSQCRVRVRTLYQCDCSFFSAPRCTGESVYGAQHGDKLPAPTTGPSSAHSAYNKAGDSPKQQAYKPQKNVCRM